MTTVIVPGSSKVQKMLRRVNIRGFFRSKIWL
jgi:hypothetical protein